MLPTQKLLDLRKVATMSTFVQKLNPITGLSDWIVQSEDYDYHQEVARSSFADMLHDTERNQKYERALKSAIERTHELGKKANVLDIGTGTGLLSMMAVKHGADNVVACEAFEPMSKCAIKVLKRNNLQNRIKIIPKRSTDLTEKDLGLRCNILVTEVFDTELIGEGALATFSHAHRCLLDRECIVVPQSATVFAQVVESPLVQSWNKVKNFYDFEGKLIVEVPDKVRECAGSAAVHDVQLSQLQAKDFKCLTGVVPVFRFDWSGRSPLVFERSTIHSLKSEQGGVAQAVFMWWELQMNDSIVLSCAPNQSWRDHWMQAIYYLPKELKLKEHDEVNLISCHDEYSMWFNVKTDLRLSDEDYLKPICECGLHMNCSRTRVGQINDNLRNKKYLKLLYKHINHESVVLVLSDGFYLSLFGSQLGAKKIYYVETNCLSRNILLDFVKHNNVQNVEVFENFESLLSHTALERINTVIGEPYFLNSILPWDNFLFVYLLKGARNVFTQDVRIFPSRAVIKGVAVKFDNLNKIRLPLGHCEGFDLKDFDDLIEASCSISDDTVEAQPLWEYPGVALSQTVDIISIDCHKFPEKTVELCGSFHIDASCGCCNGIALWVDWVLEEEENIVVSSGPIAATEIGAAIQWDVHNRQGVCLFSDRKTSQVDYSFTFDFNEGNISFKVK